MSNHLAIASVTATLRSILSQRAKMVTVQPPDRAAADDGERLNLFLYQMLPNAAWRNMDMPRQTRPGERGSPPLALNLLYLLTAYGAHGPESDLTAHLLLGNALSLLHDSTVLYPQLIHDATQGSDSLKDTDLDRQVELVHITPISMSIEEMSKLWATFQTQYRISATFEAAVVLIESQRPFRTVLPVLTRGRDDHGPVVDASRDPRLTSIEYRGADDEPEMPATEVGRTVTIRGENLPGTGVTAVIRDPQRDRVTGVEDSDVVVRLPVVSAGAGAVRVVLNATGQGNENLADWPAGQLTLELQSQGADRVVTTNTLPLMVAPQIARGADGRPITPLSGKILSVQMDRSLGPNRRVYLLLNSLRNNTYYQLPQQIDPSGDDLSDPHFDISNVRADTYRLRLRVDGVDTLLMQMTAAKKLQFDDSLTLQVHQ